MRRRTPATQVTTDLLDVEEAAMYLACGPRLIRRLVYEKRITVVRIGRNVLRIRRSELDRFLEANTRPRLTESERFVAGLVRRKS